MSRFLSLILVPGTLLLACRWLGDRVPPTEIIGEVRDDRGPVAGAVVCFKGRFGEAISDADGRFRLPNFQKSTRITASKPGYFIGGVAFDTSPVSIHLQRHPTNDCEYYRWVDPTPNPMQATNCGNCHQAIYSEWKHSGHASSATNLRFLQRYDQLLKEHPLGADVCSSCHSPTQQPGGFGAFDMRQAAKESVGLSGVHCDYCHKVQDAANANFGLTHGRYQLSLLRPEPERQLFFGPLKDVDRGDDVFHPFQRDNRLCAACHEGVIFGVPVYTTYSEWLASRSKTSCQGCHMAPTGTMTNIAPDHGGIRRDPATLANHSFFDGSQQQMLQRCLHLEADAVRRDCVLEVNLKLTATNVGHRVPTGFIDRHLVLFVEGFAGTRAVAAYHGPTLPAFFTREEAGKPGRTYARFLTDGKTAQPAAFWKGDPATLTDNRLRPDESDRLTFAFPFDTDRVRIRLVHRRTWKTERAPSDEQLIEVREMRIAP